MISSEPSSVTLYLEARDASRNLARRYSIAVSKDLFGVMVVDLSWGRIGCAGQQRRHSFDHADEAERFVALVLRQRARAPRRIGVAYQQVSALF